MFTQQVRPDEGQNEALPEPGFLEKMVVTAQLAWSLFWDSRVPVILKAVPVISLVYIISPIDILPAALLGPFGVLDDLGAIGVLVLAVTNFVKWCPKWLVKEHFARIMGVQLPPQTEA